ncbi:MAG: TetR/AcrR family transcriptional regulator [Propionicimonas sp.]
MAGTATRVTKAPEVRREELLDLALELCRTQGYEAMSVEHLTRAAGVAKGTFYHYFSSKADLQTQIVQRFGASLFAHLTTAAGLSSGSAAARLRAIMDAAAAYKASNADAAQAAFLYRDENYALRHRLFQEWREQARLVLLPVITDGVADGSMHVASAEGATDIVLLLWFDAADHLWGRAVRAADAEAFAAVMVDGSVSILQAQERVLGLPDGTFAMPIGPEVRHLLSDLHAKLNRKQQ